MKIKNKAAQELAKKSLIARRKKYGKDFNKFMAEISIKGVKARKALNKAV
jgi:hypothetical protein